MRTIQLSLFHRDNLQSLLNHAFNVAERDRENIKKEMEIKLKKFSENKKQVLEDAIEHCHFCF